MKLLMQQLNKEDYGLQHCCICLMPLEPVGSGQMSVL